MSYARYLLRRAAFAVLSAYLVVTITFFVIASTVRLRLQQRLALASWGGATEEELESIREGFVAARDLDTPMHERYVGWLVDVTTLDWGYSFAYGRPVIAVLDGRVQATLGYVLPGVAVAVLAGVLLGLFAALAKDGAFDWSVRLVAYALFGVPVFMFVIYLRYLSGEGIIPVGLGRWALATTAVAASLLAGQVRFARASALEQTGRAFVKMLRAKGADRLRLARHVLRNAAIPIVSLSMTELLAVLVLNIYIIEAVVGIPGLAEASLRAIRESDTALVIWTTLVVVFIGITGNFLQDVLYGSLDPRVRTETERQ
ncbi:ABC transporter permease [Halosimplex halophilum]|uniref:ABC transporter permease n=1 Tax=Halosimplex halophilum TaxID=2559572 RepID=UPI0014354478|nr:ABC transporter permease [Halosimplex halophilum]